MEKIDLDKIRKIHFVGVGGIGLSAIARLMLAQGKIVDGSDANRSEITDELGKNGAKIVIGQKAENLAADTELVIHTLAIPKNNPELAKAKKLRIPLLTYPESLGMLFNDKIGIAICGTHGKSTTTSIAGLVLTDGDLDPSVIVGSKVPEFHGNLRIGKGKHFIIEACEYERAFLEYWPKIIVLNNIELDHTDYYKDIEDYVNAFMEFINHLSSDGVLIYNGDDRQISNVKFQMSKQSQISPPTADPPRAENIKMISFGFGKDNNLIGYDIETEAGKTKFKAKFDGKELGEFTLKIPGKFNVYNVLAAMAVGLHLGIDIEKIEKTLAGFGGIWRRFEVKGEYKGATIISDYAHHPTAVKATIEAAREFYPGKRIVAAFQPHQHNRTKMLYQNFLKSFNSADTLILVEIFDVAGREEKEDQNVNSRKLAEDIKKRTKCHSESGEESLANARLDSARLARFSNKLRDCHASPSGARNDNNNVFLKTENIFYAKDLIEIRRLIDEKIKSGDVLLIMGAGDVYKLADKIVNKKKSV
jgi:UDP-N-acetylmuramate--alanine ligase